MKLLFINALKGLSRKKVQMISIIFMVMLSTGIYSSMYIDALKQGYNIYINQNGGWHYGKDDYSDWCHQEKLVFPDLKKNQIKIETFPGGKHFYVYIDNIQVRDGDIVKWNTYEEAYNYANSLIKKET